MNRSQSGRPPSQYSPDVSSEEKKEPGNSILRHPISAHTHTHTHMKGDTRESLKAKKTAPVHSQEFRPLQQSQSPQLPSLLPHRRSPSKRRASPHHRPQVRDVVSCKGSAQLRWQHGCLENVIYPKREIN